MATSRFSKDSRVDLSSASWLSKVTGNRLSSVERLVLYLRKRIILKYEINYKMASAVVTCSPWKMWPRIAHLPLCLPNVHITNFLCKFLKISFFFFKIHFFLTIIFFLFTSFIRTRRGGLVSNVITSSKVQRKVSQKALLVSFPRKDSEYSAVNLILMSI